VTVESFAGASSKRNSFEVRYFFVLEAFLSGSTPRITALYPSLSIVFTWVTIASGTDITVTGITFPSSWITRVIPIFLPISPGIGVLVRG